MADDKKKDQGSERRDDIGIGKRERGSEFSEHTSKTVTISIERKPQSVQSTEPVPTQPPTRKGGK